MNDLWLIRNFGWHAPQVLGILSVRPPCPREDLWLFWLPQRVSEVSRVYEAIRMQRPNEEDPQTVKDYRFDGSPANPFGSKDRESGSRRKSLGEDGSQDSVGPRCFRTPVPLKSLLRRVLRPLRARKPHKLRPEGRDRKLGGEQVCEFHSTHVKRVCTCTCALLRFFPAPLATPISSENQYAGVRRAGCSRTTPGIILA